MTPSVPACLDNAGASEDQAEFLQGIPLRVMKGRVSLADVVHHHRAIPPHPALHKTMPLNYLPAPSVPTHGEGITAPR
jgi:hypothetical protein